MGKVTVGIDIGERALKLAVCKDGQVRRVITREAPDNLVSDDRILSPEVAADFLKETSRQEKVKIQGGAVVLPASAVFTRTIEVPAMSHEHLMLNLPYEFRDFITQEKDKYFYDYVVLDRQDNEAGKPEQYELMGAATLKETIHEYIQMCRRAGFKLVTAIPEELAYLNIIRRYQKQPGVSDSDREYCFIDIGHNAVKLHIFRGIKHQATRVIDYGVRFLDTAISEAHGVDIHIAHTYKMTNHNDELTSEISQSFYSTVTLEIMRAMNFYRFNSPESNLQDVYLCGGGSKIQPLVELIREELQMNIQPLGALLSLAGSMEHVDLCHLAVGVALQ